jgi:hypothetical protein
MNIQGITKQTLHTFFFWKEVLAEMGYTIIDEKLLSEIQENNYL